MDPNLAVIMKHHRALQTIDIQLCLLGRANPPAVSAKAPKEGGHGSNGRRAAIIRE